MQLKIVVPTLNEASNLQQLLPYLAHELAGRGHIVVADGGSSDHSRQVVERCPHAHWLPCGRPGRAHQLNAGAAYGGISDREVLYFVHADTRPPRGFYDDIRRELTAGHELGCYRSQFIGGPWLMRINAWLTRLPFLCFRGGDQSLYCTPELWQRLGGFDEEMLIMEDYDILQRARTLRIDLCIMPRGIDISTRKYADNSWLRVQLANLLIFRMYMRGAGQRRMHSLYRRLVG